MPRGGACLMVLALVGLGAPAASAMSIRYHEAVLAWSADGRALLLHHDADGPEGGGSTGYSVIGLDAQGKLTVIQALVSSDFSPGGSSRPQTVTAKACEAALGALGGALRKHGFKGVAVRAAGCSAKNRSGLVTVDETESQRASSSELGEGQRLVRGQLEIRLEGTDVRVGRVRSTSVKGKPGADRISAALSPSGKLLVVFRATEHSTVVEGVYASPNGEPAGFRKIPHGRAP